MRGTRQHREPEECNDDRVEEEEEEQEDKDKTETRWHNQEDEEEVEAHTREADRTSRGKGKGKGANIHGEGANIHGEGSNILGEGTNILGEGRGSGWPFAARPPVAARSFARRVRESLFRKTLRAVLRSGVLLGYIDMTARIVVTEILLWMLVWKASACTELPGWSVTNFLLPCIVSGICQLFVRDALGHLVSKHTRECARCVQRTALAHWGSEAAWAGLKTCAGLAVAAATICASRAGLLDPSLIEIGAWQVVLTSFAVDMTRNPNHPARHVLAKCICGCERGCRCAALSLVTRCIAPPARVVGVVGSVTVPTAMRPDVQRASRALRQRWVVASHVQVPTSVQSSSANTLANTVALAPCTLPRRLDTASL